MCLILLKTLVISEATTPEEIDTITTTIPDNVDALFVLRTGLLGPKINNIVQAANERRIPTVCTDLDLSVKGVMIGFGPGYFEMGEQVARMADKVLKGASPATIPVENAETFLGINLVTAQTIGIEVPDSILSQAYKVIRPE
jgi:putative ABC transport system substrate-binding protein